MLIQLGWNPARDFGPRLIAFFAGWRKQAIPGPQNGFWVYIVGPFFGALFGAAFYEFCIGLIYEPIETPVEVELPTVSDCSSCKPVGKITFNDTTLSEEAKCLLIEEKQE